MKYSYTLFANTFSAFQERLIQNGIQPRDLLFHSKLYTDGLFRVLLKMGTLCPPPQKICDLGCGSGLTSYLTASMAYEVNGIEIYDTNEDIQNIFKSTGKKGQKQLWETLEADYPNNLKCEFYNGRNFPFSDGTFDMVLAHAVLEHIPRSILPLVVSEIKRVLKPGGKLVVARTPKLFSISEILMKSHDTRFTKKKIASLLSDFVFDYYSSTDFLPQMFPGKMQSVLNAFSYFYHLIDMIAAVTPLSVFSHHHFIIAHKK